MSISSNINFSIENSSDYLARQEINSYVAKINFILAFVQSFILIVGLLGNLLALLVINRKSLRCTSSAVFITYMAIFDSAVLILHAANLVRPRRNLFIHCALAYLTDLFTFCASWVLVIITLERCVAVSAPFLAKRFCTIHSARRSVYILLAIALIIFSSTFPIMYHTNSTTRSKKCLIRPEYALVHRIYQPIIMYGIPDILLLSNFFTIYTLIRRNQEQTSDTKLQMRVSDVHSNRKQRQLTMMLVTVNLAYNLFTTPAMIVYILEFSPTKHRDIKKIKLDFLLSQITVPILQLSNATNFLFYCFAGQRFRRTLMHMMNNCSKRINIFYHHYLLCKKYYQPAGDLETSLSRTSQANRTKIIQNTQARSNRTSTF